jgi:rare lipoprotein A
MKRAILLFILLFSMVSYSQSKEKPKQVTSDKVTAADKQKQLTDKLKPAAVDKSKPTDKSKSAVPENLKPTATDKTDKAKLGSTAKDTVKATVAIDPEIIFNDTVIKITGKFRVYKKSVHASYYHNKFNGKRTASGKKFNNNGYTAAHRKLPFGTILRITNEDSGKSVVVEVIDRGPFSRGREIDLTRKAFMEIASNKNSGSMNVKIEVMD